MRVLSSLLVCVVLAGCGAGSDRAAPDVDPEPVRDLVLITIDTWRGDHLGGEWAGERLTPALDAFAAGGVRFDAAHSAASETTPGTVGVLTGLTPRRAGALINIHRLPEEVPSLASVLSAAGFATAGVVANPVLRPGTGFERGFDHYELVPEGDAPKAPGRDVTDAALTAFDEMTAGGEERSGRRFLWVHYLDPHGPYVPPEEAARLFPPAAFEAPRDIPFGTDNTGKGAIPRYQLEGIPAPSHDGRDYLARYAAEVRSVDGEVGRLLAALEERGALDDAVVVVTSDHGEALAGDHGFFFAHNNGITQDQVEVPLVVRCPGCPAGETVPEPVSTLDVAPTALALLGVAPPEGVALDGRDLFGEGGRWGAYAERGRELALRRGDWKLLWRHGRSPELYHLGEDPGETTDVAAEHPERARELRDLLVEMRRLPALARPVRREAMDAEERERLRTLGYL